MEDKKYIPPLVLNGGFKEYKSCKDSLNEENLDVGGYIRISTKKDSQQTSVENQKKYLKEWAQINKYNLVRFYIDIKSGAYSYLRNEMSQLRDDVKEGKIKGILSKEISRTSRDIMDILELKRSLADQGAFFISIKEGYDSRTDDDEFLLVIHAGLAQKERKTTSSRVKITQMIKAREGKTNVPCPAYGYKLSEDRQHLKVDADAAKVYQMIVEKYLEGWGQLKICQWLNSQGIRSKRSDRWNTNSIKTILTNPVYLGITIYNATTLVRDSRGRQKRVVRPMEDWVVCHNTHEPLITKEKFDKIQDIIKERKEKDNKAWSCDKKYLLSGILFCEECKQKVFGAKMHYKKSKTRREEKTYYKYADQNRSGTCKFRSWDMKKLDDFVLNEIKQFFSDKVLLEERIKVKQFLYNSNLTHEKEEREKLQLAVERINAAVRKQQEAYENGIITLPEYKERMEELRNHKSGLLLKFDQINKKLQKVDRLEEKFNQIKEKVIKIIENMDQLDYTTKEALLKKIIKHVFIREDYTVRIVYNFEE
ncbi:MAG: recombinase family protein [Clostridia bacterium]|nr:recombinase family protein [Clostridia bacterium]